MYIPDEKRQIPGYAEAVKRENDIRDAAILNLNTRICGIEIRQITLRHWVILDGIGSQILHGVNPTPEEIARFLWVLSPQFKPGKSFSRWLFIRSCQKLPYGETVVKLRRFIEDTFQDSPPSTGDGKWQPAQFSFACGLIHSLVSNYHWSRETVLNLPLKEIFQYKKILRMANQTTGRGAACQRNPSDLIEIKYIRAERERRRKAKEDGVRN